MYKLNKTKEEIIKLYNEGLTLTEIATICGCHFSNIHNHLRRLNVSFRPPTETSRRTKVNENYFEVIDTEDKAYFLGFLYADGYNNEKTNSVSLRINIKDLAILETFKTYLKTDKKIGNYPRNRAVDLTISCFKLSKDLTTLGCVKAKTGKLKFPTEEQVPTHLLNHFIRGLFDGDGCIYISPKISTNCRFAIAGLRTFLFDVQTRLMENCSLNRIEISIKKENNLHGSLAYCGRKQIRKIREFLYKDATIYLQRKYDKMFSV